MNTNENIVVLGVDEQPAVAGAQRANAALESVEKTAARVTDAAGKAVESESRKVLTLVDRSRQGIERLVAAAEQKAAFAGKSGLDRIFAERDIQLRRVAGDSGAQDRIRAAYDQIGGAEKQRAVARAAEEAAASQGRLNDSFAAAAIKAAAFGAAIKVLIIDTAKYAARNETLAVVTERLAISNNLGVGAVDRQVKAVQKLGITQQEARNTVNQMIVAQLDVAKATDLARLAQNAAVVSGGNSSEALQTLIAGIVEQRVQMLRTVGIQVSFESAFHRQAAAMGKSVEQLSEGEKRQIAFNEVLGKAPMLSGAYEAAMTTAGKQMGSLTRFVDEARAAVGERFLPAMGAVVMTLTRGSIFVQEHAGLFAGLAGAILTAASALGTYFLASKAISGLNLGASAIGLAGLSPHLAIVAAALAAVGTVILLTKDKLDVQREAIQAHITNLQLQRDQLDRNSLSFAEYARATEESTRKLIAADVALAKNQAERNKLGSADIRSSPYGVSVVGSIAPESFNVGGKTVKIGDYESRYSRRDATYNQKQADKEKAEQEAIKAMEQARTDRVRIANETFAAQRDLERAQRGAVELDARLSAKAPHNGVASDAQFQQTLENLILKVNLDMDEKLREKRYRVDEKTGNIRDMSGDRGFKQVASIIEEERSVLIKTELKKAYEAQADLDEKYFRDRLDRRLKEEERVTQVRQHADLQLQDEVSKLDDTRRDRMFDIEQQRLDRTRNLQTADLGGVNAVTLGQKLALEDRKLAIEQQYNQKSLDLTMRRIHLEELLETSKLQALANVAGLKSGDERFDIIAPTVQKNFDQVRDAARAANTDKDLLESKRVENEKIKMFEDRTRKTYDTLKHAAEGVIDAMISKTQSLGDAIKNMLKSAILTPIKDILSSQIAGSLTTLLTGRPVGFAGTNYGGRFGGIGAALGSLGMGGNVMFGGSGGVAGAPSSFGGSLPAVLGSFGMPGAPGGTPGFAGPVVSSPGASGSTSGGGLGVVGRMSGMASGAKGWLTSLGNIGYGPKGGDYGGEVAGSYRGVGGMAGGAMLLGGAALGIDGLRRGGLIGLGETAGAGALIGGKFGGPVGAAIGAGIGALAGLVRLFIKGANEKVKEKIRSAYGISVDNKGVLEQIVQTAKSTYGGDYDLAIRSPQIRDLLELYAMSSGQKFPLGYAMHPLLLQQQQGSLYQSQQYSSGSGSFGYSGSLPYLGGANPGTVITSGPPTPPLTQTITLDGAATTRLLQGQAVNVINSQPRLVANATIQAAQQSSGRQEQAVLQLSPMTLLS